MGDDSNLLNFLSVLLLAVMLASAAAWVRLIWKYRGKPSALADELVPLRERERPFWNPGDALILFGAMQLLGGVSAGVLLATGMIARPEAADAVANPMTLILVTLFGSAAGSVAILGWLRLREPHPAWKLGLHVTVADVVLGLRASVLLLPPVLLISAVASQAIPYEHPVLDAMAGLDDPLALIAIFVATAIVTPFVEELLFRVLLQGGLERWATSPAVSQVDAIQADLAQAAGQPHWQPGPWWPVVVSSAIFAMLHIGQGAAPIPLFFLALGLGYLYRQTGNITAPMVVHMILNGMTIMIQAAGGGP